MKFIVNVVCLALIVFAFNHCSSNEGESGCTQTSQEYTIEKTWTYTTHDFQINVSGCIPENRKVLVDGTEVETVPGTGKINFIVPEVDGDSAVITLKAGNTTVFEEKIAVFPGSGTWTQIANFSGDARMLGVALPASDKIYVVGGYRYATFNTMTYYGDYHSFNPATSQWSLAGTNALLEGAMFYGTTHDGKMYIDNTISDNVISIDPQNNDMESLTINNMSSRWTTHNNVGYRIGNPEKGKITISTLSPSTETWVEVKQKIHGYGTEPEYILIESAFSYGNKVYFITFVSSHADLWSYDPVTTNLELVTALESEAYPYYYANSGLRFLFAHQGLFYFMEKGGLVLNSSNIIFKNDLPGDVLIIYNLAANEWVVSDMEYPEQFHFVTSFSANDKLFAGLSVNGTEGATVSAGIEYSNKFYQFTPK